MVSWIASEAFLKFTRKRGDCTSNYATSAFWHMNSNLLFINEPTIRRSYKYIYLKCRIINNTFYFFQILQFLGHLEIGPLYRSAFGQSVFTQCLQLFSGWTQLLEQYVFVCHLLHVSIVFGDHQVDFKTTYMEKKYRGGGLPPQLMYENTQVFNIISYNVIIKYVK